MQGSPEQMVRRLEMLKGLRINYDSTWQRVQELVWPFAGDFTRNRWRGERRTEEIYESTATMALDRFSSFFEALLTPRNAKWHKLRASTPELNESQSTQIWMDNTNVRLFQTRNDPNARYYSQKHEGWKAIGAFGNDTLFIDERKGGGIRYRYCHLGRTWIQEDHEGVVETVYYEFPLKAYQAISKWGPMAPETAREAYDRDPFAEHTYVHCVTPRHMYDPDRLDPKSFKYESTIVIKDTGELVEESGYHEQPYKHSRYTVNPGEMYGRGPAELVMPDIETLQEMEKTFQRAGHKVADPPLLLQSDGPLGRGSKRVMLRPGGLTYGGVDANGRPTILPLQTGANLPMTEEMMQQKREMISSRFLNDLFLMLARDKEMTATEVLQLAKEQSQLLTPTTGRQESEMLGPQIEREVRILQRQGSLLPLPPELEEAGGEYEIVYDNEAARMQRAEEALAIEKTANTAIAWVTQGADPTILEIPNWHDMLREVAEINGTSAKLLNDKDAVRRAIQATAERAKQAEAMEMAQAGLEMAGKAKEAGINPEDMTREGGLIAAA